MPRAGPRCSGRRTAWSAPRTFRRPSTTRGSSTWWDVAKYLVEGRIVSDDAVPLVLPAWQVQDIDNVEDWERAEMLFRTFLAPPAGTPD
jgi:hypothetical protein